MVKGLGALGALLVVTTASWVASVSAVPVSQGLFQFLGALALVGFAAMMAISTRHQLVDALFGGLDRAYVVHKWLGFASVGLAVTHVIARGPHERGPARAHAFGALGFPSLVLFGVLVITAVVAKRMEYQAWKNIHKFVVVPYAIGLVHYYGSSSYGAFSLLPFSLWLNVVNIAGVACAVYSVFLYERLGFPFRYQVVALRAVATGTIEVTGRARGRHLTHRPGQFAFVKFPGTRNLFPSHPFTVSGSPGPAEIQFTIKALGDHTSLLAERVRTGDEFVVSRAHGRFDYTRGSSHQIWIAAGIGVAPFRRFLQSPIPHGFSIDFFYAYRGSGGPYRDELVALAARRVRLHLVDADIDGHLTADTITRYVRADTPVDVYFCGPVSMRNGLRAALARSGLRVRGFHFEEFRFAGP